MTKNSIDNDSIRGNLRKLRRARHMSQAEVAEKIGINLSTYKHLEAWGGTSIIHRGVEKIPDVLGVSPEALFCRELTNSDSVSEERMEYGRHAADRRLIELGNELILKGQELSNIGRAVLEKIASFDLQ